ncbi:MAG: YfhO family protein [Chloroflexi bacterium]|nr:YfhO family protein [Chloroflexota bacterium]
MNCEVRMEANPPTEFNLRVRRIFYRIAHLPTLLLLPFVIVLFFNKMALSNLILARGDTFLYFYPYWEAAADALQHGRVPLWNTQLFMGAPFLANSQVGFFYPLNWPLWLLLPIPYAVSASILLHIFIAGWGAYLAAQRNLYLDRSAALATAILYALGAYLTAQIEHVNQLQGMAWLPWFLVVLAYAADEKAVSRLVVVGRTAVGLATLFSLQLLAGHAQTTFITGVGVLIWGLGMVLANRLNDETDNALLFRFQFDRFKSRMPLALLLGGGLAIMMTAIQLLPTVELTQLSSRMGGLSANEALSFSLHPLLLAKSLLPAYGQSIFSEYVAFFPVTALVLAVIGAWQWRQWRGVLPAVLLVLVALVLALGQFNPLNWLIVRLPGFNLFRAPARWMLLYSLGVSLLAGLGWQIALDRWLLRTLDWRTVPERARENLWHMERPLRTAVFLIVGLLLWSAIATIVAPFITIGAESPYEAPSMLMMGLWSGELLLIYALLGAQRIEFNPESRFRFSFKPVQPISPWPLALIALVVLFVSTRTHSYNSLTTPEAYFDLRPAVTRLQAASPCRPMSVSTCPVPSERVLSLSDIFFDPGDQTEIDTIYADQLSQLARADYTVAIKQKEVVSPNLPMVYGLSSVDGFDGGVLPIRLYSRLMELILPADAVTTDGRLREHLTQIPDAQWLDLFNTRYVITDKTGDTWLPVKDGLDFSIYFDRQHQAVLKSGESVDIGYVPAFPATALYVVSDGGVGEVEVRTGTDQWMISAEQIEPGLFRFGWPTVIEPLTLTLHGVDGIVWQVHATTLVNESDGSFQAVTPGAYRLIHSGDVKIYENLDVMPRAYLVYAWEWQPEVTAVLDTMQAVGFDERETAVLFGEPFAETLPSPDSNNHIDITQYLPEQITLSTQSETDAYLILTDAFYPGWVATVDGVRTPIFQANGLFRAVQVPAGEHEIIFQYDALSYDIGRWVSLVGFIIWAFLLVSLFGLSRFNSMRL